MRCRLAKAGGILEAGRRAAIWLRQRLGNRLQVVAEVRKFRQFVAVVNLAVYGWLISRRLQARRSSR